MAKVDDPESVTETLTGTPGESQEIVWDRINTGLGKEWDFERNGNLVGRYLGAATVETDDPQNPGEKRESNAYQFEMLTASDDTIYFVWGSADIDKAFEDPRAIAGAILQVAFLGRESFTGANGPQQIKRYAVRVARQ